MDLLVKNPPTNAGVTRDTGLIPGSGRPPGVGNGTTLQYPCLENTKDTGDPQAVHGATVSDTTENTHTYRKLQKLLQAKSLQAKINSILKKSNLENFKGGKVANTL